MLTSPAQLRTEIRVVDKVNERFRELLDIAWADEEALNTVADGIADTVHLAGDNRLPHGL